MGDRYCSGAVASCVRELQLADDWTKETVSIKESLFLAPLVGSAKVLGYAFFLNRQEDRLQRSGADVAPRVAQVYSEWPFHDDDARMHAAGVLARTRAE